MLSSRTARRVQMKKPAEGRLLQPEEEEVVRWRAVINQSRHLLQ